MLKPGDTFKIIYMCDELIRLIAIIEREGGVKLKKPIFKFEHLKNGRTFQCRQEDIDRSFQFKDWIPVKEDPATGKFIDL